MFTRPRRTFAKGQRHSRNSKCPADTLAFHRFVALRYLAGAEGHHEGRRFLRFITYAAVGGVAIGVATLLLSLAIVRGFSREIEAKIVGFGAHVQVENIRHAPLEHAASMMESLGRWETVERIDPVVSEFALLGRSQTEMDGASIWGATKLPSYLREQLVEGICELASGEDGAHRLVMGGELASRLGLELGDRVTVFSTRGMQEGLSLAVRPNVKQFTISGIYETFLADFDETYVFTDIDVARSLLDYGPEEATRLDLTLAAPDSADAVAQAVETEFGFPVMARTIFQVYRGLFAWVELQEAIIPFVVGVMILVAAFNIVGTLLMVILEKAREIGILASMGASGRSIRRLFLWLGMHVGLIGTAIGIALASILALIQIEFGVIPLPADAYYMDKAPVALAPVDFVAVSAVSIILCLAASYIPARVASRISPLRIIRFG